MKILLTGSTGQLGQALTSALHSHELVLTDSSTLDITDETAVMQSIRGEAPEIVINAAAYTRVDDAETDIESAYRVNADGPRNLASACNSIDATLLHVSTDYVFDGRGERPWNEDDQPNPLSVYGKSKLAGEENVKELIARHYIVRTAWLYHISGQNFLRTMYGLSNRPQVRVVNDQIGSPTNADDLAQAIARLIETESFGTRHMVNAGSASWYELTREFYRLMNIQTQVVPVTSDEFPRPAPRPHNSVLVSRRTPAIRLPHWKIGLERLVRDLQKNPW